MLIQTSALSVAQAVGGRIHVGVGHPCTPPRPLSFPQSVPASSAVLRRRALVVRAAAEEGEGGAEDAAGDEQRERLLALDEQLNSFLEGAGSTVSRSAAPTSKANKQLALNDAAVPEDQQPAQELADLKVW